MSAVPSRYYAIVFPLSNQNKWLATKTHYALIFGWILGIAWAAVPTTELKKFTWNGHHYVDCRPDNELYESYMWVILYLSWKYSACVHYGITLFLLGTISCRLCWPSDCHWQFSCIVMCRSFAVYSRRTLLQRHRPVAVIIAIWNGYASSYYTRQLYLVFFLPFPPFLPLNSLFFQLLSFCCCCCCSAMLSPSSFVCRTNNWPSVVCLSLSPKTI